MRVPLAIAILAATALTPAAAADIAARSRIDAVTVFPAGAEIVRLAEASFAAGEHSLIFADLPGDLQPESLRVEGSGDGPIEIGSVDSRLAPVPSAAIDAKRREIAARIETLQDERSRLDQTISDAEYQKSLMQQLAGNALAPAGKDGVSPPSFGAQELGSLLDLVGGKLKALSATVLDARLRQRAIDRDVADLEAEMARLAPQDMERMTVTVHLTAPKATSGVFRLKYRIANAGWQPIYDARLATPASDGPASLELVRRADVVQSTTESWQDVALTLSTSRPLGATAAPELMPYQIILQRSDDEALSDAVESDSGGAIPRAVQAPAPPEPEDKAKQDGFVQLQADVFVAGFQALYAIPGRVTVDNSGTAKKVRIDTTAATAQLAARAVPKLDPNAYLTAAFKLPGDAPLLPGPVMLYRDGVFMGQGALPALAPGEEARLGFGVDDLIKVKRAEVKHISGEEGLLTTSQVTSRAYDITVNNLHAFAVPVTILDQMPYSTREDVTVDTLPGMTPPTARDVERRRGVLAWEITAKPKAEVLIRHGYKISSPQSVVVGSRLE